MIIDTKEWCCQKCVHRPIDNGIDKVPSAPVIDVMDIGDDEPIPVDWDNTCPYLCGDSCYNRMPEDDDFCSKFEKGEKDVSANSR